MVRRGKYEVHVFGIENNCFTVFIRNIRRDRDLLFSCWYFKQDSKRFTKCLRELRLKRKEIFSQACKLIKKKNYVSFVESNAVLLKFQPLNKNIFLGMKEITGRWPISAKSLTKDEHMVKINGHLQ